MSLGDQRRIGRDLERLWTQGVDPTGDGDLLERFRTCRDEAAFETLVMRHGPMVRGVCRRLLRDPHDADDAFQATFLVLARKGSGLRDPDRLGPWLYGVASRVAAKARVRSTRRRTQPLPDDFPAREDARADWSDVAPILDAEVSRLPAAHREVLIHCLLGGVSEREASRRLGCPVGTIKSRLSRAKDALRTRLVRRGVAPATALAAMWSVESFASPVSLELLQASVGTALAKAGSSSAVAALAQGVAPNMLSRSLVLTFALLGFCGAVGLTMTSWSQDSSSQDAAGSVRPNSVVSAEQWQQIHRNLRGTLLALNTYHSTNRTFPQPAIEDAEGRPLLSWRVALLPQLDAKELYEQFHLDEPWDSPHNRTLLAQMPGVFQTPGISTPEGMTRIRGFTGPGRMFDPAFSVEHERGIQTRDVRDGTSRTAFLTVADPPIEWTRPDVAPVFESLTIQSDSDAPQTKRFLFADGPIFGMVDGSTRTLPEAPNRGELIAALLTRDGGERVVFSSEVPPKVEPGGAASASLPPQEGVMLQSPASGHDVIVLPSPALQERLERMEERLERILQRLDAIAPEAKP